MATARAKRGSTANQDPVPESDCLAGFSHPRRTGTLFGHAAAETELLTAYGSGGRMHHAWLFAGPRGIGKATLAYRLARLLLNQSDPNLPVLFQQQPTSLDSDPASITYQQVAALSHPGLLLIRRAWDRPTKRFRTAILVDDVRRMRSFINLSASDGGWRVIIVDQADEMNLNAANALLKSLEEPPERCVFVLIASEPARLLATIHSRCRRINLAALNDTDLRAAVEQAWRNDETGTGGENADWEQVSALSAGSVRSALVLAGGSGLGLYGDIVNLLQNQSQGGLGLAYKLADKIAPVSAEPEFEMFYRLLLDCLARIIRHAATGSGALAAETALATSIGSPETLAQWARLWETVVHEKSETQTLNLDRRSFVLQTCFQLQSLPFDHR